MGEAGTLTLRPIGLTGAPEAVEAGRCLAGGGLCFSAVEAVLRRDATVLLRDRLPLTALEAWGEAHGLSRDVERILDDLTRAREGFAGLSFENSSIMGIINVTPDSFSDGGDRFTADQAVAAGLSMWREGAEILDVGGESTRPGAEPVGEAEELRRVIPVVRGLAEAGARVSIDSHHARVVQAALEAGASIVNDVTALTGDPASAAVVAEAGAPVVLMHMRGEPRSMQRDPRYDDVALDIYDYLSRRIAAAEAAGIPRERIAVDPGIGFGKTVGHNLELLRNLAVFHGLGCPLLLGASRKSFIGKLSNEEAPKRRLPGSIAAVIAGAARGCQIFRVHDVAETRQALALWQAVASA